MLQENTINGNLILTNKSLEIKTSPKDPRVYCTVSYPSLIKFLKDHDLNFLLSGNEILTANFGRDVTPSMMRLLSATIRHKHQSFTHTVIKQKELRQYLTLLKSCPQEEINEIVSIREYSGIIPHWYSVQIHIKSKNITLLFLNSTGWTRPWDGPMAKVTTLFRELFPKFIITFYIDYQPRQFDDYTCSLFTLMDIKCLTRENVLDYCKNHIIEEGIARNDLNINIALLPINMMRMTQSSEQMSKIASRYTFYEQRMIINKNGQTLEQYRKTAFKVPNVEDSSYQPRFNFFNKINATTERNFTARNKLEKLFNNTINYVSQTAESDVDSVVKEFSLEGFEQRIHRV